MAATGQLTYDWSAVQIGMISDPRNPYSLNYVYVEFSNVAEAGDTVVVPSMSRANASDYYAGLALDPCNDYLRLPVLAYRKYISNPLLFSRPNAIAISTVTGGVTGFHGKPFSHTAISKIYGMALVAAPNPDDPSHDIVYDRAYFSAIEHAVKLNGPQITVSRSLVFT